MKRCPTCDRAETDDALTFCRIDGTPLVRESGPVSEGAGTLKLGSALVVGDTETRILPQAGAASTEETLSTPTAQTTVLDGRRASGGTQELSKPKSRKRVVIAVAAIILAALTASAYIYFSRGKSSAANNSVAVLPFVNAGGDSDLEYLSDGMTESLINSLSQLPNVRVMARTTMFSFKGKDTDPRAIGKQLGVETVLTGRVVKRGDRLTIQADMVNVSDGSQMWGEQYNRQVSDLLAVQTEIAREIVGKLRLKLSGEEHRRLTRRYTDNAEAYQLYLRGRYHWNKRDAEEMKKGVGYFNQAVALDPSFALAYAGLADSYALLPFYAGTEPAEDFTKAKAAATRALEIDDALAEAHATFAHVKMWHEWDWAGAEREFKRAVELNPNYPTAHHWYALCLSFLASHQEALAEIRRAHELDPFSLGINLDMGVVYLNARQYDEAIKHFQRANEMNADFLQAHLFLAESYEVKGMYEEAAKELEKVITLSGGRAEAAAPLRSGYRASGERGYFQEKLKLLMQRWQRSGKGAYQIAEVHASLGEEDQAFGWLEKSYERHDLSLVNLKVTPRLDPLRTDPRFKDLLRRVGLPQ